MAPDLGLTALRNALGSLGYSDELVRYDFPVWSASGTRTADLVGFGCQTPQDMTTATILAARGDGRSPLSLTIELARALAAPAVLLAKDRDLELWSVGHEEAGTTRVAQFAYPEVELELGHYRRALEPEALLKAKREQLQMRLFPIDVSLLASARSHTADALSGRVERALALTARIFVPHVLGKREPDPEGLDRAGEAVVGAMAALVARDKLELGEARDPGGVLDQARERFPDYFQWVDALDQAQREAMLRAIDDLGADINYASLDSSVVSSVYERALVSEALQRELGIYYTPPELARRVAEQIPVEELAPEARIALDPACGSGSLLVAAYDRLQYAAPADIDPLRRHEYARSRLIGSDADRFAVQLARLTLLLHAMPAGDHWQVTQRAIEQATNALPARPTLIFSNPPWRSLRPTGEPRAEMADQFVLSMLDAVAPGGFLAFILPASWLTSRSSRQTRDEVARRASVFEVWRLPRDTFGSSNLVPCVVMAKAEPKVRPFIGRRIPPRANWPDRFYRAKAADESYLALKPPNADGWLLGPLHRALRDLDRLDRVGDIALVQLGPPPRPPVAERGHRGPDLWLRRARDLPPFGEASEDALGRVRFPQDFSKRGGTADLYKRAKVLVSSMSTGDRAWRIKVSFDHRGLIPRQSLCMIIPEDDNRTVLYGLATIMASSVASAWVGTVSPRLYISPKPFATLPIPDFGEWGSTLADLAVRLEAERRAGQIKADSMATLEETVLDAYGLKPGVRAAIARHFAGERAPEGVIRYPALPDPPWPEPAPTRRFGAVLDVRDDEVKLWVPGLTPEEGEWMAVPARLPGWLAEPGKTFEIAGNGDLQTAQFAYQSRSYLGLDELAETVLSAE